jgi:hypothetical protein
MTAAASQQAHGRPAPVLVLCRQSVEYVVSDQATCPHCGRDPRQVGAAYRASGHAIVETMQRLERVLERRGISS